MLFRQPLSVYAHRAFEESKNDTAFTSKNLAPTFETRPKSHGHLGNFDRISRGSGEL
jgi:hypothetical protein